MKIKPWPLVVLALLHILAPIGNLVLNAIRSNRTLLEQWNYWFHVLPPQFMFLYVIVPILAGIFIYICRRWSYGAYLSCIVILFCSNLYSLSTSLNWTTAGLVVAILVIDLLVVAYFFVPSVQKIYMDPRLRWWEAAPRYHFNNEGFINERSVLITNLSDGGLFVFPSFVMEEGDKVNVSWTYEGTKVAVAGEVVYKAPRPEGTGYGIKFAHTPESEKGVNVAIKSLHRDGKIVRERLPGPEDSFIAWLKKLIKNRDGLFPKV
jgi:PilZ domain.